MDERIKNKVREIQHKYCGEPVETKLYFAIKETIDELNSHPKPETKEPKLKVPKKISFDIKDKDGKNRRVTFKSRRGSQSD